MYIYIYMYIYVWVNPNRTLFPFWSSGLLPSPVACWE